MIVLSASGISKAYGVDPILEQVSFHLNQGDRVGLVGANGAGKSTLFRILTGRLSADSGECFLASNLTIGYLEQSSAFHKDHTVYDEMLSIFSDLIRMEDELTELSVAVTRAADAGQDQAEVDRLLHRLDQLTEEFRRRNGYGFRSEINGILQSMAFPPETFQKKIHSLSGGEITRLSLAALLLKKPDLLLLDEPTNHLDIGTLKWLEGYLTSYTGTILLISHDRYFLDQTVNRILEIEDHRLSTYTGNYTAYATQKKDRLADDLKAYEKQQKEIARQEEMIRRFRQHGTEKLAKRAHSREVRLEQVEVLERPKVKRGRMSIQFKQGPQSGNDVLAVTDLSKSFGSGNATRRLFSQVNFQITRGERICLVGANGIGKTTLLRMILSELPPDQGRIHVGHNVKFGYYDQRQQTLSDSNTVLGELHSAYRMYTETELRGLLGRFLFQSDDVFKPVAGLSGGERARLSLLKLMLSGANFLVMDEPTNHLDIASKEVFEDALLDFPGTLLLVSHDRYFLNKIPNRILELTEQGVNNFLGGYDYYMEKKQSLGSAKSYLADLSRAGTAGNSPGSTTEEPGSSIEHGEKELRMEERRRSKEQQMLIRRRERELGELEKTIAQLEDRIQVLEEEMSQPEIASNHQKLVDLSQEYNQAKADLEDSFDRWLTLQE